MQPSLCNLCALYSKPEGKLIRDRWRSKEERLTVIAFPCWLTISYAVTFSTKILATLDVCTGKKITAGHRPKTDQKAGMAVYLHNSPDIKPTRAREIINIEL